MWAWLTTTASMVAGSTGNCSQFRNRRGFNPWNNPQSSINLKSPTVNRYRDPVTVPAPPRNFKRTSMLSSDLKRAHVLKWSFVDLNVSHDGIGRTLFTPRYEFFEGLIVALRFDVNGSVGFVTHEATQLEVDGDLAC